MNVQLPKNIVWGQIPFKNASNFKYDNPFPGIISWEQISAIYLICK